MLDELAQTVRMQAENAGEALEELREGILALQLAMGEGGSKDLAADSPLALLNNCHERTAKMCVAVSGTEDPETGKILKRGLADDVHSATTWILGDEKQPALPGVTEAIRKGVDGMKESIGEGNTMTLSRPGSGREPVTLHGKSKTKGDADDGECYAVRDPGGTGEGAGAVAMRTGST